MLNVKDKIINVGFWGFSQFISLIVPLIIAFYVIDRCGIENWGKIAFYISVFLIVNVITDYGNLINGVKIVSTNKKNNEIVRNYLIKTYNLKFKILLFLSIIFLFCTLIFNKQWFFFVYGYFYAFSFALSPIWFYQATENFKNVNKVIIFSKALQLLLVFLFINSIPDYKYYFLLLGISNILVFTYYLFKIKFNYSIKIKEVLLFKGNSIFKEEWPIVFSNLFIVSYIQLPIIMCSFYLGNFETGGFKILDMFLSLFRSYFGVIFSLTYPRFCFIYSNNIFSGIKFLKKVTIINLLIIIFLIIFILLVLLYFPFDYFNYIIDVKYIYNIIFIPIIFCIYTPFYQLILFNGKHKEMLYMTMANVMIILIFGTILIKNYNLYGLIFSIFISEIFITISYILTFFKFIKKNT